MLGAFYHPTARAGALSRLEGPMIDGLNTARQGAWWGYVALFLVGVLGIAISALYYFRPLVASKRFSNR
jgi:hypothetical protein